MSKRSAEVELILKTAQFKAEARSAKDDVESLDRAVEATDRDLKKLPPDAAKAAAAMKLLGAESANANLKLEDGAGKSSTALGKLESDLAKARGEARRFAEEFNRTGSGDSLTKMFKADDAVKELEKLKAAVTSNMGEAGKMGGQEFTKNFSSEMQGFESNPITGPAIGIAIAIGIAAAAPAIGAALDAALLLGLGGGVIALGIVGQISNPIVHAAFADMANDVMAEFRDATSSFAAPLVGAAHLFGDAFQHDIMPHLKTDFGVLAKEVEPLAAGLGGMLAAMMPGFDKAIGTAAPILHELALDLPQVGQAFSDFFDSLSGGQQGAIEGLRTLLRLAEGAIETTGDLLEHLSNGYANFSQRADAAAQNLDGIAVGAASAIPALQPVANVMNRIRGTWDDIVNGPPLVLSRSLDTTAQAAQNAADNMQELSKQIGQTYMSSSTLAGQMTDKLLGSLLSTAHATLGFEEALTRATDSIKQNGRTLDIHTAKGQANQEAILNMVDANKQLFDQNIANGMQMQQATQVWDDNIQRVYAWGASVGIGKSQMDGLIGTMKNVPDTVNMRMVFDGLQDSIDRLDTLLRQLNGLPFSKEVHVKYYETIESIATGHLGEGRQRWGGVYEHAQEGALRDAAVYSPSSPARYAFAEPATGGEAFIPKYGDSRRSTGILSRAAGWYGMDVVPRGMQRAAGGGGPMELKLSLVASSSAGSPHRAVAELASYAIRTGALTLLANGQPVKVG